MNTDMTWDLDLGREPDYDIGYWTRRDGTRIKIKLMENKHIENSIKMLKRNLEKMPDDCKKYYSDYFKFKIRELNEELEYRKIIIREIVDGLGIFYE